MAYAARRLLVVEDEPLIATLIIDQLAEIGCDVVGPAHTISEARRLALAAEFHAAILDWNMRGTLSTEIADILSRRQIPFLFITGYAELPFEARSTIVLNKPHTREELQEAVQNLLDQQSGFQQTAPASELQKASPSGVPQALRDEQSK